MDFYEVVPNTSPEDCGGVTAEQLAAWMKLSPNMATKQAAALELAVNSAVLFAEKNTRREITFKTFNLYRDCLGMCGFEIRRAPLKEVVSLAYLDTTNTLQIIDAATYYIYNTNTYSSVLLDHQKYWPTNVSPRKHNIICTFTAGYEKACDVPEDLRAAILTHATNIYVNRGDCDCSNASDMDKFLPAQSKAVYAQYRILQTAFI
jgi:uncharacterized phiE125 gp8 family phage protein